MDTEAKKISEHMKEFGYCLLARAIHYAAFSEYGRPYVHAISITLAHQASEILIKARIAEEHPLLIF